MLEGDPGVTLPVHPEEVQGLFIECSEASKQTADVTITEGAGTLALSNTLEPVTETPEPMNGPDPIAVRRCRRIFRKHIYERSVEYNKWRTQNSKKPERPEKEEVEYDFETWFRKESEEWRQDSRVQTLRLKTRAIRQRHTHGWRTGKNRGRTRGMSTSNINKYRTNSWARPWHNLPSDSW